jgi:translation elongation factor P/translation initiation factor 5A
LAGSEAWRPAPTEINLMKIAQELRTGNVIMIGKDPMVVQKAEYNKSGRNAAVVKLKLKNLLNNSAPNRSARPTRSTTC